MIPMSQAAANRWSDPEVLTSLIVAVTALLGVIANLIWHKGTSTQVQNNKTDIETLKQAAINPTPEPPDDSKLVYSKTPGGTMNALRFILLPLTFGLVMLLAGGCANRAQTAYAARLAFNGGVEQANSLRERGLISDKPYVALVETEDVLAAALDIEDQVVDSTNPFDWLAAEKRASDALSNFIQQLLTYNTPPKPPTKGISNGRTTGTGGGSPRTSRRDQ